MVVCPCDVPLITPTSLRALAAAHRASGRPVTLAHSDRWEPLIGVYGVEARSVLEAGWARGAKGPKLALGRDDVQLVSVARDEVRNVNTPTQVAAVEDELAQR